MHDKRYSFLDNLPIKSKNCTELKKAQVYPIAFLG